MAKESAAAPVVQAVKLPGAPPDGWQAVDLAGGPRVASFRIAAAEEGAEPADMGVTVFPGTAGGLLANVNRWRGEVGQANVTEEELTEALGEVEVDGQQLHIVDAANLERRTLGAILPLAGETWFFKLTGPLQVVTAQSQAFYQYLEGLEIGGEAAPATPPEIEVPPDRPQIAYTKPEAWVEGEPTSMRVASFTVTGSEGREADISAIPLSGSGGAQLAIINQWRSTLRLEDATENQLPEMVETIDVGGRKFQLVNFESDAPMLDGDLKARILVGYATVGNHTWFFKIAGETSLVAEQQPVLLEFLKSVEFDSP